MNENSDKKMSGSSSSAGSSSSGGHDIEENVVSNTTAVSSQAAPPLPLCCTVGYILMLDPVMAEDGYTYERENIERCIRDNGRSPMTRQSLTIAGLHCNHAVKDLIEEWVRANPESEEANNWNARRTAAEAARAQVSPQTGGAAAVAPEIATAVPAAPEVVAVAPAAMAEPIAQFPPDGHVGPKLYAAAGGVGGFFIGGAINVGKLHNEKDPVEIIKVVSLGVGLALLGVLLALLLYYFKNHGNCNFRQHAAAPDERTPLQEYPHPPTP